MSLLKCKMCGGNIIFSEGEKVGVCESCGTRQTIPNISDEKKANLIDRANHFRLTNDYDKAQSIYEQILIEDATDAEIYWSIVLCKYGIEYVEDPTTRKRLPTVNRVQYESILQDDDYKKALELADSTQKALYEEEAEYINNVQKGILDISKNESPYDVFICYKETDDAGRRTRDSVLANDLYHELTNEGFKVFYARITLEDKVGEAYEPYIFAALNSSKAMIVLGTKPEYFKAVWVKNEWSRYLNLIKKGEKKILIPAYKDMDPYDMPDEFSNLQAQDMSKLGFMQDLVRGIKKVVSKSGNIENKNINIGNISNESRINSILRRVEVFIDDGDYDKANEYCEKALDIDAKNADVYFYKLLIEINKSNKINEKISSIGELEKLENLDIDLKNEFVNFDKIIKYDQSNKYSSKLKDIQNNCVSKMDLYNNFWLKKVISYSFDDKLLGYSIPEYFLSKDKFCAKFNSADDAKIEMKRFEGDLKNDIITNIDNYKEIMELEYAKGILTVLEASIEDINKIDSLILKKEMK